ncbi:DUF6477 family protein [Paracoccaceae bacterium GXU_MW_L88]
MKNALQVIDNETRPTILLRAAKTALKIYRPERFLPVLIGASVPAKHRLARLRGREAEMNSARVNRSAEYNLGRHIELLTAMLFEMRRESRAAALPLAA